ncbi:cysteine--tRNA ligase [Mariprofundus sp. EBB-1]|uniref:cysteine--tRNA ligase n=1 Tax=Mariprofundus sp. EBB-1 TaxID=2650971 RepID=UPI000EF17D31|nr:cysteine--tRNA ligase [Mariprofundus sp. EBB-1]RLL53527.1 cysteine--tRNA ligase [Mariprofundus sp. EBB-1]
MSLSVYNSLHRRKELFEPLEPNRVGMYVCGVTVYDYCHVGHARVMVVFDVIHRWLTELGFDVNYVRNFTDVDDKIIKRASERGIDIHQLTNEMIAAFQEDIGSLGCLPPSHEPRATAHMPDMVKMIGELVARKHAYVSSSGDVLYAVRSFDHYGQLSGKNIDDLESGSRVDVDDSKRDPLDFVLWKMAKPGEPAWDSPWGQGRPGWHIECSAMSCSHLGNTFDIHGGGMDLKFPHHENEIAQACASNDGSFARYWLHNGFVNINAEKMSKSLGNFFTIREVTKNYHPEVLRMFILGTHYRSPLDFSDSALDAAKAGLDRLYETLRRFKGETLDGRCEMSESLIPPAFTNAMNDDFNTTEALASLFDTNRALNKALNERADVSDLAAQFKAMLNLLAIGQHDAEAWFKGGDVDVARIEALIAERGESKKARDFARADAIRDALIAEGIVLEDSPSGTTWKKV